MSDDSNITDGSVPNWAELPSPWDDAAFKQRVRIAAENKGLRVREALVAANVSPGYLDKSGDGRSTAVVLRLARILDVPPAYLYGVETTPRSAEASRPQCSDKHEDVREKDARDAREKLVKLSVYTKIISTQLATLSTLAYIASNGSEAEAKVLATLLKSLGDQLASNVRTSENDG